MLANQSFLLPSSDAFACPDNGFTNVKRKRRPAGTPDPDAEVVYLSPEMLMESDRYVCDICNQSFQREQNLQMHRRRHKVPWKLLKSEKQEVRKRVYVCPEPTCLHHDPSHALGDLVGIKKHFRRKHSNLKQFVCEKCSKGYAVQSDYKAHVKICGTKGHSCDCGRVFSRVETFIEHQDTCKAQTRGCEPQLSISLSLSKASLNSNFSSEPLPDYAMPTSRKPVSALQGQNNHSSSSLDHNLELRLELFSSNISSCNGNDHVQEIEDEHLDNRYSNAWNGGNYQESTLEVCRMKNEASQILRMAMEEKVLAEKKRQEAKCLIEMAKQDMTNARKIREQVVSHYTTAHVLQDCATNPIDSNLLQVTCHACKKVLQTMTPEPIHGEPLPALFNISFGKKEGGKRERRFFASS